MMNTLQSNGTSKIRSSGLPESYNIHWSGSSKADVVRAVRDRLITFDEARWRYLLSRQEFKGWQKELSDQGQDDLDFELAE